MDILDRISYLLKANNKEQKDLTKFLGIKSVAFSEWKSGKSKSFRKYLIEIAEFLNVSIDYLVYGKEIKSLTEQLSEDEQELIDSFKELSTFNKGKVIGTAKTLVEIEIDEREKKKTKSIEMYTNPGYIESYTLPASANSGVDLNACERIMLKVKDKKLISDANFAVRISGDSMEPEFHDGEYALVRTQPQIELGSIGIFTVNADGYIKKLGAGKLISLNPEYDNIQLHEYDDVRCRGEVIGTIEPDDIINTEEY